MKVECAWEHNGNDTLLYAVNCVGAYARGANREQALDKLPKEVMAYLRWSGEPVPERVEIEVVQEKASDLQIADADSDILFEEERGPLS